MIFDDALEKGTFIVTMDASELREAVTIFTAGGTLRQGHAFGCQIVISVELCAFYFVLQLIHSYKGIHSWNVHLGYWIYVSNQFNECNDGSVRIGTSPLRRFASSRLVRSHRRKCNERNEGNTCVQQGSRIFHIHPTKRQFICSHREVLLKISPKAHVMSSNHD